MRKILILFFLFGFAFLMCSRKDEKYEEVEITDQTEHAHLYKEYIHEHTREEKHNRTKHMGETHEHAGEHENKKEKFYYCPMHPGYKSDKPGKCPICGMDLVPAEEEEISEKENMIHISPKRQQALGVKFEEARKIELRKKIRAVSDIEFDERNVYKVSLKYSGWIEKLYANFEGKFVRKGEKLFEIYSPEVVSAQEEFISALGVSKMISPEAIEKAKLRLLWWDIPEEVIDDIARTRKLKKLVPVISKYTGFIVKKNVFEGEFVEAGKTLFEIADLSTVWLMCHVYESDIPFLKVGDKVNVHISYTTEDFVGRVDYIYPELDKNTRTLKVRIFLPNRDFHLKPGMFGEAEITVPLGKKLVVSESSVINTGKRKVVFVDAGDGYFEVREIETGVMADGYIEIKKGLNEGERVVSSANFLVDSEAKLKEAIEHMH